MSVSLEPPTSRAHGDDDIGALFARFVEQAHENIAVEVPDADVDANHVLLALNRTSQAITYDLESGFLRPLGLSWSTYRLLFVLWNVGDMEPSRLASLTGATRASVSNLVKPLSEQGLVLRTPSSTDKRAVLLSLTEKGHESVKEAFAALNAQETRWVGVLTPVESQLLGALLRKLLAGGRDIATKAQ